MKKDEAIYMYIKDDKLDIDKLVDDFSGYLYTIIQNSGNFHKEDIEEIISDAYLILWKNQHKLELDRKMKPYLVVVTKNLIRQKYPILYKKNENIEDYEDKLITNEKIDIVIENNEINRKIVEFLNTMKNEEKEIFYEFYFYSRKIKEIAIEYNMSESTVKTKLYRTRNKIRKELLKGGYNING